MPLFELASALSCELPAAYQLATRLSETTAVQNLAEKGTALLAREKIAVGIADDPFDSDSYQLGELQDRHFFVQVYAETDEGHLAALAPEAMGTPREGGVFRVYVKRQVRDSEDRADAYSFFWDRVSAIGPAVLLAAEQTLTSPKNYRFKQVGRMIGPEFGARRGNAEQGDHLIALLRFTWGDVAVE